MTKMNKEMQKCFDKMSDKQKIRMFYELTKYMHESMEYGEDEDMKKYVVICYAVHEKEIASHDAFDNEDDAYAFLEKDAQNTYEEEMNNASEEDKDSIDFTISDDGSAYLSSYDGEYEWTWEVIEAD